MPQMKPMSWTFLFLFFLFMMIMFNILNFFLLTYKPNSFLLNLNFKKSLFYSWKW